MVRDALMRRAWLARRHVEIVPSRTTGDRCRTARWPRSAARRCGPRSSTAPARRRDRLRGAFDEGCRDDPPREIAIAAMLPRADVRDRLIGAEASRRCRRAPWSARARRGAPRSCAAAARPEASGAVPRQCRHQAGQARGRRSGCDPARRGRARPAGTSHDIGARDPESDVMLPAPAQGAVGIEARADDSRTPVRGWLAAIDDGDHACVRAARTRLLAALKADCHSPVAALATIEGDR
jgi:hydroxymethylbilane synthase